MKIIIPLVLLLVVTVTPVYGQALSNATGFVHNLDVSASGYVFPVQIVANFAIPDFTFDEEEQTLTLFISSSLDNNLGEVILPKELLGGNLTFSLNDDVYTPAVHENQKISFIILNFLGSGQNVIEITGTTHLFGLAPADPVPPAQQALEQNDPGSWDMSAVFIPLIAVTAAVIVAVLYMSKLKKNKQG